MLLSITKLKRFTVVGLLMGSPAMADTVQVAVASNFVGAMDALVPAFQKISGHQVAIVPGSTGKFYAQIKSGAPFEVFLSADQGTPAKLEKEGLAVPQTQFTYARGRLVLWSENPHFIDDGERALRAGKFQHISLANPVTAPYGAAAIEVISHLGLESAFASKKVLGENIAQAHQFVATRNAELGFVAMSQVFKGGKLTSGSGWVVPQSLYAPLLQDAVLLKPGEKNEAALAFLQFLKTPEATSIIISLGYEIP